MKGALAIELFLGAASHGISVRSRYTGFISTLFFFVLAIIEPASRFSAVLHAHDKSETT